MVLNGQVADPVPRNTLPATPTKHFGRGFLADTQAGYINESYLFYFYFLAIPNWKEYLEIDCERACQWFVETYREQINDNLYSEFGYCNNKSKTYSERYYTLKSSVLVYLDLINGVARILFTKSEVTICKEIEKGLRNFRLKQQKVKPRIHLLISKSGGLGTVFLEISKPKLQICDNYNDDFLTIHTHIQNQLSKKDEKGIVLLHGKPGTGKTSYIRYLISSLKKNVIFLPPNMASAITNPNLISVLIDNPNSIFVIEDAENIVVD